jgi:hypothetical protein
MMQPSAVVRATPFGANSTTWESTLSTSYEGELGPEAKVFTAHPALRRPDRAPSGTFREKVAAHIRTSTKLAAAESSSIRPPCESICRAL